MYKWKCPKCGNWVRDEIGKTCQGCKQGLKPAIEESHTPKVKIIPIEAPHE